MDSSSHFKEKESQHLMGGSHHGLPHPASLGGGSSGRRGLSGSPPPALRALSSRRRCVSRRCVLLVLVLVVTMLYIGMWSAPLEPSSTSSDAASASDVVKAKLGGARDKVKDWVNKAAAAVRPAGPQLPNAGASDGTSGEDDAKDLEDETVGTGTNGSADPIKLTPPKPHRPVVAEDDTPAAGSADDKDAPAVAVPPPHPARPQPPAVPAVVADPLTSHGPLYDPSIPKDASTTLLIVVPTSYSAMENEYRSIVRSTWGKWLREYRHTSPHLPTGTKATIQLYFFIGTKGLDAAQKKDLDNEHAKHKDIVFLDFQESYVGLSAKMLLLHGWIHDNRGAWPNLRFVFKTDTDVWFNVPELMKLVDRHAPKQTMIGYKYVGNVRLTKGKWANPEYSAPVYPQYMAGAGYLLSADIASWVAVNDRAGWLKPLPNEDAVLGIWLAGSPVKWIHSPKFKPLIDPRQPARITRLADWVCQDSDILFHHLTGEGIRRMHRWFTTCGSPCEATCRELQREAEDGKKDEKLAKQAEARKKAREERKEDRDDDSKKKNKN